MTPTHRRILVIGAIAAAVLAGGAGAYALATKSATPSAAPTVEPSTPGPAGSAPVIMPGRPGESAQVTRADQVSPLAAPGYSTLDTWYIRMMIPHHTQALQMAALAPNRAEDPRIRALADRIKASQGPEIHQLRAWLDARGLGPEDASGQHEHGTMRGMQTPEAMKALAAAKGDAFDRMFVQMMTDHHQGAIEMSRNMLRVGVDLTIQEIATSTATEQQIEITRMRELLKS
ncbi:DUF305 domain-containing protein [Micromonospora sp. NPDC049679]|uniref:DUF305 domain-containing protein n=1 Tax=Micromonospora sp. NPDC049679 TaxID=3155920 RepID=UPI0033ECB537